jgi:predicted kinase
VGALLQIASLHERRRAPELAEARRVHEQTEELWCRCLELGLEVVLDLGFWNRQERDATRAKISALGAQMRLYRLTCSAGEAWQRIEKRNADLQGNFLIVRNTFETLKERFEPLDPDEARIEITT